MMIQAVLSNPKHPEYGVATIPFPIPRDQYAHCMELLEALEIGDAVKADCKVTKIDSFYTVLKLRGLAGVEAVQPFGEVVQFLHIDREHLRALEDSIEAVDLFHLAVRLDRVADLQRL